MKCAISLCQLFPGFVLPIFCSLCLSLVSLSMIRKKAERSCGDARVVKPAPMNKHSIADDWVAPIIVSFAVIGLSISLVYVLLSTAE